MAKYEIVIGLEIHAQLRTESKMFCSCDNYSAFAEPNTNVCSVCLGMPGMLPVANKKAIESTFLLGFALNGKIADEFNFERKNYFYPDLPKAYQITSSTNPPVIGGYLEVDVDGEKRKVRLHHIHLEEDAGKLVHPSGADYSLVDLNRAGTPLMEIVSEPDIRSPKEARVFMQDLRSILRYLSISDANMEQGNMRCDANISLREVGVKEYGTKVEIKNMNSFKMIEKALEYEVERQTEMLDSGERIIQETRGWDDNKGKTLPQRSKEEANDYRYFPEPDLPPFNLKGETIFDLEAIRLRLPELPKDKKMRFIAEYGLNENDAENLTNDLDMAQFFERTLEALPEIALNSDEGRNKAKKVSSWILSELVAKLNADSIAISETKVSPENLGKLVELIDSGKISGKIAKEVFAEMYETGVDPEKIISSKGLSQISDEASLVKIIEEVILSNPKSVEDYQGGNPRAFGFFVGQVMAKTKGQANPQVVNKLLREKLG